MENALNKCSTTWTPAEIKADSGKDTALRLFCNIFNNEILAWEHDLDKTLFMIDSLASGHFPSELRGHYQRAHCIGSLIGEELKVIECNGYSNAYVCVIEVTTPEAIVDATLLLPVHYHGLHIQSNNPDNLFIREPSSPTIRTLHCNQKETQEIPSCVSSSWDNHCSTFLLKKDFYHAIKYCSFARSNDYPIGTLLGDGSLLVQGDGVVVKVKTGNTYKTVTTESPCIVFSETDILVEKDGEVFKYPGTPGKEGVTVVKSKLTKEEKELLESIYYWANIRKQIGLGEYVDIVLTALQLLFAPLSIVGVVLGRKANNARKHWKLMKEKHKQNYKHNSRMLPEAMKSKRSSK
jgi:hypothetical protein